MKTLSEKVASLLPILEERGAIYLFALFERDDAPGKWDVVLSSDWSDQDSSTATRFISDVLVPKLNTDELAALSRIAIIPSSAPAVTAMATGVHVSGGVAEVVDCNFMGLLIKHAFVFRSQRPPAVGPQSSAEAAASTAD